MSQHSFKRFIHQLLSLSDYTTIALCLLCRKEALKCNCAWYSSLQFETNVLNVILKYPQIGFCIYIRRYHKGFPAFQADDVTKVHVVSYTYIFKQSVAKHKLLRDTKKTTRRHNILSCYYDVVKIFFY